jgi:hypothetical protein
MEMTGYLYTPTARDIDVESDFLTVMAMKLQASVLRHEAV